jgi:hypothetical protein
MRALEQRQELRQVQRLLREAVEPGGAELLIIVREGVRCQRQEERPRTQACP